MKTLCIINIRFEVYGVCRFDIINRLFSTQPLKFTCTETDIQDFLWLVRALFSSVHQRPGGRGWVGGNLPKDQSLCTMMQSFYMTVNS